jgi:GrpB-like predicted nucleotidyltransferase (UPF0157 family)
MSRALSRCTQAMRLRPTRGQVARTARHGRARPEFPARDTGPSSDLGRGLLFGLVPFSDEKLTVTVHPYDPRWPAAFALIAAELHSALGDVARAVDHIGSTSIPGMPAKDCIDVQVRVDRVDSGMVVPALSAIGFRLRPEPWNLAETSFGVTGPKLVFAPPVGARTANVHVRAYGSPHARFALLFRDYLRNSPVAHEAWGAFKVRLAQDVADLSSYGQIKQPATVVLMEAARRWAVESGWITPD